MIKLNPYNTVQCSLLQMILPKSTNLFRVRRCVVSYNSPFAPQDLSIRRHCSGVEY